MSTGKEYDRSRSGTPRRRMQTGSAWRKASKTFLAHHPYCAYCGKPAQCVDHYRAHKGNQRLFWDHSNWRPCCLSCNSRKNLQAEGGMGHKPGTFTLRGCDENGWPLDRTHHWKR
jgi:5-methylcytosine-specific restriction endonuclease McrA